MLIPFGVFSAAGAGGGAAAGAYELISTTLISTSTSVIYFNSIPQTYKHLQIRSTLKGGGTDLGIRLNSTSSGADSTHTLLGNGSSVSSLAIANTYGSKMYGASEPEETANAFGASITDILDYASTSKSKTVRTLAGYKSSSSMIALSSYRNSTTDAITSIQLNLTSGNMASGSRFSLYGIKG